MRARQKPVALCARRIQFFRLLTAVLRHIYFALYVQAISTLTISFVIVIVIVTVCAVSALVRQNAMLVCQSIKPTSRPV